MFLAALFTIAKTWKQPKCLLANGMSHKKKNEIFPFAATWMDLENIILSEVRQISYAITYMWNVKNNTNESIYKTETDSDKQNKLLITKGRGGGVDKLGVSD